jgi:alpha-tubulin suppressor-like RCC1 family protein
LIALRAGVAGAALIAASIALAAPSTKAISVSLGGAHACAVTADGAAQCWGYNGSGQLGDGTTIDRLAPVVVSGLDHGVQSIAAGAQHTCAILTSGELRCWGDNEFGQLGVADRSDSLLPVAPAFVIDGIASLVAGSDHTCGLSLAGAVACWGRNDNGQLGNATYIDSSTPVTPLGLNGGVAQIAGSGSTHVCARMQSGDARCWGGNYYGTLGDGTTVDRPQPAVVPSLTNVVDISASFTRTCAVRSGGDVLCFGVVDYYQLNGGLDVVSLVPVAVTGFADKVVRIAVGPTHNCALEQSGAVQCFGDNIAGQLGDDTTVHRSTPSTFAKLASPATSTAAGGDFSCAITESAELDCWGVNYIGQLGTADSGDRHTPTQVLLGYVLAPAAVIEYYNSSLDHYFMTLIDAEIAALDSGTTPGWQRTGYSFKALPLEDTGYAPVCRFYIPPNLGDSHFYSAFADECDDVRIRYPTFVYESGQVMWVKLPDVASGACPAGTLPVYRLWNHRADSNHRYTTDLAVRSAMIARGYVPEGYGPDGVAMCAPS